MLGMVSYLKKISQLFRREYEVYQLVLKDRRTPKLAKALLIIAVGYAALPFDLVPDFIPVIGQLDDIVIIPALVALALKLIPKEVVEDCRKRAKTNSRS
jgi:uncharacterized membrane protein YkvA (DUF1232 family)